MSDVIVLENDKIIIKVLTLGAILNSFYIKSLDRDIVLGFDDYSTYLGKHSYSIGKSIGRCANRIGNSRFSLNGVEYQLLANNGPNSLHGGEVNFGNVEWKVENKTENKVVLSYDSKDMEAGYPGNLHVEAIYELKDTELKLTYTGISDKDTILNMTNHSYFNLDKVKTDILSHSLLINADKVNLNDENGMASDKVMEVKNTPFDFLDYKLIGDAVSANGVLLNQYCKGIIDGIVKTDGSDKRLIDNLDTNYLYENLNEKIICILKNDKLKLNIISDLPCVQIYTGKVIDVDGREGHYGGYAGVAIEPQFCPNAINYENFLKPVIKANEKVSHVIKYRIAKSDTV